MFALDECLGGVLLKQAMQAAGAHVQLCRDHFGEGTSDEELLQQLGSRGWVFVSKDTRIRRITVEREALVAHRVASFFLVARKSTGPEQATLLAGSLPRMLQIVAR